MRSGKNLECSPKKKKTRRCLCFCSVTQSYSTLWDPWTAAHQASLSFTISQSLLKRMSIESMMPSNHHILCHPLLLLPSVFPSIRVFSNESVLCIRWPNIGASASASGLRLNIQDWFPFGLMVWSYCSPSGSKKCSPTPQFKGINYSAFRFLYSPTLTSIHDY